MIRGAIGIFFQAEDGIRDIGVTGVQTCALPIWVLRPQRPDGRRRGGVLRPHRRVPVRPADDQAVREPLPAGLRDPAPRVVRAVLLWVAVLFIGALLFATVSVVRTAGVTPIVVLAVLVLALLLFGIVGALLHPPER